MWAQSGDDQTCGCWCAVVRVVWGCASVRGHGCVLCAACLSVCRYRVLCVRGVDTRQDVDHTRPNQQVRNQRGCTPLLHLRGCHTRNASSLPVATCIHPFGLADTCVLPYRAVPCYGGFDRAWLHTCLHLLIEIQRRYVSPGTFNPPPTNLFWDPGLLQEGSELSSMYRWVGRRFRCVCTQLDCRARTTLSGARVQGLCVPRVPLSLCRVSRVPLSLLHLGTLLPSLPSPLCALYRIQTSISGEVHCQQVSPGQQGVRSGICVIISVVPCLLHTVAAGGSLRPQQCCQLPSAAGTCLNPCTATGRCHGA